MKGRQPTLPGPAAGPTGLIRHPELIAATDTIQHRARRRHPAHTRSSQHPGVENGKRGCPCRQDAPARSSRLGRSKRVLSTQPLPKTDNPTPCHAIDTSRCLCHRPRARCGALLMLPRPATPAHHILSPPPHDHTLNGRFLNPHDKPLSAPPRSLPRQPSRPVAQHRVGHLPARRPGSVQPRPKVAPRHRQSCVHPLSLAH